LTGLGTSQRRGSDGGAPERPRSWQLWPPEISWDAGPLAASARRTAASLRPASLCRNHRLFTIAACVSVIPRVIAALGFKPALLIQDSFSYLAQGVHLTPLSQLRPAGYPMLLKVLEPFHSLLLVTTLQHLMGIALAVIIYAVLRSRGLPAWGATLAAAPTLFDSRQIWLESSILPDTLFTFVLMIAIAILVIRPKPAIWQAVVIGLLVAWAAVIRGNGAPVVVIIGAFLLLQRVGWKVFTACLAAFAIPVAGYALAFFAEYGQLNITNSSGMFLWSRTMSFANCSIIKPPADLRALCPTAQPGHPTSPAPPWSVPALLNERTPADYLWAGGAWYRVDKDPGINAHNNKLAMQFAERAIEAQPADYLKVVGEGVFLTFAATDRSEDYLSDHFTVAPHVATLAPYMKHDEARYAHTTSNTHVVQPWAFFMFLYQLPVWFPGWVFFAVLVGGLVMLIARWRRGWGRYAGLAWGVAVINLVVPIAAHELDYRYALSAVPFGCLALGLAFIRKPAPRAAGTAVPGPAVPGPAATGPAGTGPAATGVSGPDEGLVADADAQAAEAFALALDLDDLDPADLAGRGHVGAAVRLLVQAHDIDHAHVLDVGRHQVGGGPDDVGQRERLVPGQHPHVDAPAGLDLGVAGGLDRVPEPFRQLGQVEVHPRGQRLHVAAGDQRAEVTEHHAAQHVQAGVRAHQRGPALVLDGAADRGAGRRQRVAFGRDQVQVVALARPLDPGLHPAPQQDAVVGRLAAAARVEGGPVKHDPVGVGREHRAFPFPQRLVR
jgi:hypothetical protein